MIFEFSDKQELEAIIKALDAAIDGGYIAINESSSAKKSEISDPNQPDNVNRFFSNNSHNIIGLLDLISEPVFIKDNKFNWVFVNQSFCNFFGVNQHDIVGKTSHYLFPKSQSELFEEQDNYVLKTGNDSVVEEEVTDQAGITRIIVTKKKLYTDSDGIPFIIGSFYEITHHKDFEKTVTLEKSILESRIKERTFILSETINKLQEEITQRNDTENALKESEEKFRSVIEQSLEGISLANSEGKLIEWNKGIEEITGLSRETVLGMYIWDLEFRLMPDSQKKPDSLKALKMKGIDTLMNQRLKPENRFVESQIITPDGILKSIHLTTFEIKTNKDFYVGCIVRDITKEKAVAETLQTSESQYKTIFQFANDAILIINPDNADILAANDKASEVYGQKIEHLTKMNLKQLCRNFSYDQIQLENLKKNHVIKNFETVHYSAVCKEIFMLVNGSVITYNNRKAIMNIYNDITELKQSEKARVATFNISQLIHSASRLEDLYEPIHNIVGELMNAANFFIALFNEEHNMLTFPYYVDEKNTKPHSRKPNKGLIEYVIRTGKPLLTNPDILEELVTLKEIDSGEAASPDWIGVPLITQKKVIGAIVVQSYEIGPKYTSKEKDLLVFISEQIATLIFKKQVEEEIFKAKDLAEESDKLKTAFIANMSHELRTPMTGIIGFTSILAHKATDKETKTMLDYVLTSSNRLMNTLNSILELSQLESGKKPLEIHKSDINHFIEPAIAPHLSDADKKNIEIKKVLAENVLTYYNNNFLMQILNNLISNAVKFTEKGIINISTGITEYLDETYSYVSVSDTGIGISPDNFKLIFEDFRQVSEGMNRTYEGTGLGLSLCKKMAEMMGGHILVESKLGTGSTFTLLLPYAGEAIIQKAEEIATDEVKKPEKTTKSKPKILVVDDNMINVELIIAYLKNNYKVETATNGEMAIELAKRTNYDVILMDINLGEGIDGIQATNEIRKLKIETPIIAITAYSTEKVMKENIAGFFTNYLLKPFDRNSLVDILEKSIKIIKLNSDNQVIILLAFLQQYVFISYQT